MQHGTCRGDKIKAISGAVSLAGRLQHNLREKVVLNADPAKKGENEILRGPETIPEIVALANERLATVTGKINPNSIKVIEFIATVTADSLEKNGGVMTPDKIDSYLDDSRKFLENRFGAENVISVVRHNDETVPHLHLLVVPIKTVKKEVRRVVSVAEDGKKEFEGTGEIRSKTVLNSQDFFGSRGTLSAFQQDFYDGVSAKYGLERGSIHTTKRQEQSDISVALEYRSKELANNKKSFQSEYERFRTEKSKVEREKEQIEKMRIDLEKREKVVAERVASFEVVEAKNKAISENFKKRENTLTDALARWKANIGEGNVRVTLQLEKCFHGLDEKEINECWKYVEKYAQDLRDKKVEKPVIQQGLEQNRGRGR